ncbi:hypothetical protein Salat_1882700 [Sesamum alatum]|uniref:Uncharacterized protein n=1 Tax=Sesamum alatum TaxID=300844 RepID=A0AAE1Y4F0_9LAMI|nr:hypothetical protein Salat_1882700 [Sesamum alatum]
MLALLSSLAYGSASTASPHLSLSRLPRRSCLATSLPPSCRAASPSSPSPRLASPLPSPPRLFSPRLCTLDATLLLLFVFCIFLKKKKKKKEEEKGTPSPWVKCPNMVVLV